jgi:MFS family permease
VVPAPTTSLRFALLSVAVLVEAAGIGALFPLLARIQAADHLPTVGLGLMSSASFFAALVGQVGLARHLDGPRARTVLLVGLVLGVVAEVWFGTASQLWELTAARALGGVSYGVVMPAALRAGSTGVAAEHRGARLGRLSSMQMLGIVIGPLVGAGLYSLAGLRAPFYALGAAGAVVAAALVLVDRRPLPAGAGGDLPAYRGDVPVIVHPRPKVTSRPVASLLLLAVAMQLPNGLYDALWSRLLTDRGAATLLIGASLTCFGIPYVLLAPLGGRLAGRRPLVWSGVALAVASCFMASYGFVPSPVVITVLGVFEACFQAVAVPGGYAAAAAVFPDNWAATGQGWYSAAGTAAAGAAALAGASLYSAAGPGVVFAGGAAVSIAFIAASLRVGRRRASSAPPRPTAVEAPTG